MDLGSLNLFRDLAAPAKSFYNSQEGARYAWQQVVNALGGNADSNYGRWLQSQFQTYWANYQNEVFQNTKEADGGDGTISRATPRETPTASVPRGPGTGLPGSGTGLPRANPRDGIPTAGQDGRGPGGLPGLPRANPRDGGDTGGPAVPQPPDFTDWLNGHGGALSDQWQMLTANQRGANPNKFLGLGGRQLW